MVRHALGFIFLVLIILGYVFKDHGQFNIGILFFGILFSLILAGIVMMARGHWW